MWTRIECHFYICLLAISGCFFQDSFDIFYWFVHWISMSVLHEYFSKVHIPYFFRINWHISAAILILIVFLLPIYIRFRYLDHLVANRMASSMCLDPCGMRWGSWFQTFLYHISTTFGVYVVCALLVSWLIDSARSISTQQALNYRISWIVVKKE